MWLVKNKSLWRVILLALLAAAYFGPWLSDIIHVPAQFPCGPETIRLQGDFCGFRVPGIAFVLGVFGGLLEGVRMLIGGEPFGLAQVLGSLMMSSLFLPFVSKVILLAHKDNTLRQILHIFILLLGFSYVYYMFVMGRQAGLHPALWGMILFLLAMVAGVVLEGLALVLNRGRYVES